MISSKERVIGFLSRIPIFNSSPHVTWAFQDMDKWSVGRVSKKRRQQESLQGTNILRHLKQHLVFIYNTNPSAAWSTITPTIVTVGVRVKWEKQLVGHQGAGSWVQVAWRRGSKELWVP